VLGQRRLETGFERVQLADHLIERLRIFCALGDRRLQILQVTMAVRR
jgi:hypothetical protein